MSELKNTDSNFDLESFKVYVNTYDKKKNGLDNDETIIKDMLYGIGISLDKGRFRFFKGFTIFKSYLKDQIL